VGEVTAMNERWIHWAVVIALLSVTAYAVADEVTLTTYYPSPRGVYDVLQARSFQDFDDTTYGVDPNLNTTLNNVIVQGTITNGVPGVVSPAAVAGSLVLSDPQGIWLVGNDNPNFPVGIRGKFSGWNRNLSKLHFFIDQVNVAGTDYARFNVLGKFRVNSDVPGAPNPILDITPNQLRAVNGKLIVEPGTGVEVNGNMRVNGNEDINGKLQVDDLTVMDDAGVIDRLTVDGVTTLNDDVNINGKLDVCCVGAHISNGVDAEGNKNFVQPHPFDPTRELVYTSLEGREVRIYFDGVARLRDGEARIRVPEDFKLVSVPENLNVVVTPFGEARSLYVAERSLDQIVVRSADGGDGEFGYFVMATRMGFEEARPVQENVHFRPDGRFTPEQMEARMAMPESGPYYAKLSRTLTRRLLMQNGLMTPDGKLNKELVQRLGWEWREDDVAQTPAVDPR
jgi:hypothetical protein